MNRWLAQLYPRNPPELRAKYLKPYGVTLADVEVDPSELLLLGDSTWFYSTHGDHFGNINSIVDWHSPDLYANILYLDGHVSYVEVISPLKYSEEQLENMEQNFKHWPYTTFPKDDEEVE